MMLLPASGRGWRVWGSVALVFSLGIISCKDQRPSNTGTPARQNAAYIANVGYRVQLTAQRAGKWPPLEPEGFARWLAQEDAGAFEKRLIKEANGVIVDLFQQPIIILSNYMGIVSVGPNGKWDNGSGDDAVWLFLK